MKIPGMRTDRELMEKLTEIPTYTPEIRKKEKGKRLSALNDLYSIYIPSLMSQEIYVKLYLATQNAIGKKNKETSIYAKQCNQNFRQRIYHEKNRSGIIGGADSLSITGVSGIGKSSAISAAMSIILEDTVCCDVEDKEIIPILQVQTPFDCSSKGLLIEICRQVDEKLQTNYVKSATRISANTDTIIGLVSQVCLNHIGTLVIDEIQNVKGQKKGESLIGMLTQLVNSAGISIVFVGTSDVLPFFEKKMQLARRTTGLHYSPLEYGAEFKKICRTFLSYVYTKETDEINEISIAKIWLPWLYEHSGGIVGILASLIHDAQEIAILSDDCFSLRALNRAYQERFRTLHKHIDLKTDTFGTKRESKEVPERLPQRNSYPNSLQSLLDKAKKENLDMLTLLKSNITVEEIRL